MIVSEINRISYPKNQDYPSGIISREAAYQRLKQIPLESEEFCVLQRILLKTAGIFEVMSYKVNTHPSGSLLLGGFGSCEHIAIGEAVILKGIEGPLQVKEVVSLDFAYIVALAGDVYGVAGGAISLLGGTDEEKKERFKKSFATLWEAESSQLHRIIKLFNEERHAVKSSALPRHCYSSHLMETNSALSEIKKDVGELLLDNSDHFFTQAKEAYTIGHDWAREVAKFAKRTMDREMLKKAYAIDAFACHFLTDLFSSGHIDNQRGDLEIALLQLGFTTEQAKMYAGILTGAQHEKAGLEGLNVKNGRGEEWQAYGDGSFQSQKNEGNKKRAIAAVQKSVDEVFAAYNTPEVSVESKMKEEIPFAAASNRQNLYTVAGEPPALYIYPGPGADRVKITSKWNYYILAIPLALENLPQDYIDHTVSDKSKGFVTKGLTVWPVNKLVEMMKPPLHAASSVADKVIVSAIESHTDNMWRILGVATYFQVRGAHTELQSMIHEMASVVQRTYASNQDVLNALAQMNLNLQRQMDENIFGEIIRHKNNILQAARDLTEAKSQLNLVLLQRMQQNLFEAYRRISTILRSLHNQDIDVVVEYSHQLARNNPEYDQDEIRIATALWFREMIDIQIQGFDLSKIVELNILKRNLGPDNYVEQLQEFRKNIESQIERYKDEKYKDIIDITLVDYTQDYISLQLKKSLAINKMLKE